MPITLSQSEYFTLFAEPASGLSQATEAVHSYPASLGQGKSQWFRLRDGLELAVDEFCLKDDLVVTHCDRHHPLEYTFEQLNPNGKGHQRYHLYGSGLAPGEPWRMPGNTQVLSINVHIEPELFEQWMGSTEDWPDTLKPLMRSPDERYYERTSTPTPAMQMTVQQIFNCPFQGMTQRLYLESKVWELMALLMEDLRLCKDTGTIAPILKADDIERIHYASKVLRRRLVNPPSLMELARTIGINDHKLKVGFRQVFGTTVFGYLHEQRMEKSRQLLESGDLNVTEAAQAVGFASRGHFANAFRRKYGVNPGVYARQRRSLKLPEAIAKTPPADQKRPRPIPPSGIFLRRIPN
ncbi:AraC family transcriptional regulator [Sphaerothrix gracilis]|uniref:helix-turn-helix transcriptional regulator n=1 Tax=Sphaerothrix gracilis TaxID=3151835 RepID=UPI0031FBE5E5